MYIAEIPYYHNGLNLTIGVLDWEPYVPKVTHLAPEHCYPSEGGFGEWEIIEPEFQHLELEDDDVQDLIWSYFELENQKRKMDVRLSTRFAFD